ncbi:DUF4276 family protein [Fictibacillus nanhaiensis]|uniref:DUF4276 family protein n=1 Tax=Fictibacillus nanhaiensis TaxID=742169 RepID=UPI003C284F9E
MTKRIHILVEGQTEETFVKEMLAPHLWQYNIYTTVTMVCTRVVRNVRKERGGIGSYSQIKRDIIRLCKDTNVVAITTLFDFYGLPSNSPGLDSLPAGDCYQHVKHIESQLFSDINEARFIPFVMLHEFETIIFCDPTKLKYSFPNQPGKVQRIIDIADQYDSPEKINNSPQTAPSKRILSVFSDYEKIYHGCTTALDIGLDTIRSKCSHFNDWLSRLESL